MVLAVGDNDSCKSGHDRILSSRRRLAKEINLYGVPCAVKRRRSSAGEIPAWQLSLRPVAIGAVVEATKRLKPLVQRVAWRPGEHAGRNVSER